MDTFCHEEVNPGSQFLNFELRVASRFVFLAGILFSGCSHGLEPPAAPAIQPGFGGTVHFVSQWPHPPGDSVYDIRVVAFFNYPPQNILNEVIEGQAVVYPPIGSTAPALFVDSLSYSFDVRSSATFQYVAVAMQYGPDSFNDWKVVGAYGYSHGVGTPDSVVIPENTFINGINIDVDFQNTPPTPIGTASVAAASR